MVRNEPFSQQRSLMAYSAGGVCYRFQNGQLQVVLIATQGTSRWGLPKGQVGEGEAPAEAARRELSEETGIEGTVIQPLETIEYWFRSGSLRVHKFVDFFLLKYSGGSLAPQLTEVDDARWFGIDEAIRLVSFPRERGVLEKVLQLWQSRQLS
ncbi:MAG: NUDIX hydrolase [Herpetosiphonaceae bacterium]|nr:MAG: NUDIX hydrolase [Herpetosiphonaceae bacterium]